MPWELRLHDTLGTFIKSVTSSTTPLQVIGGFDALVAPSGDCQELTFGGRNDLLHIPSRGIVQYLQNGIPIFWGPTILSPALDSPGAGPADPEPDNLERFVVAGGAQLVRDSLVGPLLIEEELDVAQVAYRFCLQYAHPALIVNQANFPKTNNTSNLYGYPYAQLDYVLEQLAKSVPGCVWGVNAQGAVFMKVMT